MRTSDFLKLLRDHPRLKLGFAYGEGAYVRRDYHITEVKHLQIRATDCGGRQDSWEETVIQLWEPPVEYPGTPQMRGRKASEILSRVDGLQPLQGDSLLRFEYGNAGFHTSQLEVAGFKKEQDELILLLAPQHTTCKARDICGVPEAEEVNETPCQPGSGCC